MMSNSTKTYLQALPGKASSEEVHEHVTQRLQIIPSALLWKKQENMVLPVWNKCIV